MGSKKKLKKAKEVMGYLGEETPEKMGAFKDLLEEVKKDGAIPAKTKELIFVAIAVKAQCDLCIAYHVAMAKEMGLSDEEILEAAWVAVAMGGGPSLAYISHVKEALEG